MKPREWKIDSNGSYDSSDNIVGPYLSSPEPVHVIEYSAYNELKLAFEALQSGMEIEKLTEQNKIMRSAYEALQNGYNNLMNENDKIKEEIRRQNKIMREALESVNNKDLDCYGWHPEVKEALAKCGSTEPTTAPSMIEAAKETIELAKSMAEPRTIKYPLKSDS